MSTTTETADTIALPKGLGRRATVLVARIFAPGLLTGILLQHCIVLPAQLAPVAGFLGLHVGA